MRSSDVRCVAQFDYMRLIIYVVTHELGQWMWRPPRTKRRKLSVTLYRVATRLQIYFTSDNQML